MVEMLFGARAPRLTIIAVIGALLGCSDPDEDCRSGGGEFGINACARITGIVRVETVFPTLATDLMTTLRRPFFKARPWT
jgi:hypothetical protein